jgi:SOS-response transcriptional repressor LexA
MNFELRQQAICDFVDEYWARNWTSPTVREIAAAVGLASTSAIVNQLGHLVRAGRLERKVVSDKRVLYRVRYGIDSRARSRCL